MLTKGARPEESNTWYAQGGIIYRGKVDSPGAWRPTSSRRAPASATRPPSTCSRREGPRLVDELLIDDVGVPFDRADDGPERST